MPMPDREPDLEEVDEHSSRGSRWKRAALYVGLWTFLGVFMGGQRVVYLNASGNPANWAGEIAFTTSCWYVWGLLSIFIVRGGRRFPIAKETWRKSLLAHIPLCAVIVLLDMAACFPIGRALGIVRIPTFRQYALAQVGFDVLLYWGTLGVAHAFAYHRKLREHELRASRLAAQLAKTQLQVLRMQIHPHFLFNTLNAISTLMHRDLAAAERMLVGLGDLLRLTIHADGAQETPLRNELDILARYIDIMKTRFGEQLAVDLRIDPAALDAHVPAMILQPLVENAFRHGIGARAEGGRVEVSATTEGGRLVLEVRDDGPGLAGSLDDAMRRGMGLANTRDRLRQLYGNAQEFEVRSGNDVGAGSGNGERDHAGAGNGTRTAMRRGFVVSIVTPLRTNGGEAAIGAAGRAAPAA
jgi:signal transduction histidine kinase